MRIVVACSNKGRNGCTVYARRIARLLAARGHAVWVAAEPGSALANETAGELPLLITPFRRWPLDDLRRVADFCRRERIDVFHSHLTRSHNFGCLLQLLHGVTSVAHMHNELFRAHGYFHSLIITPSRFTLGCHQRWLYARGRRGVALVNFADTERFRPASGPDRLRQELGAPPETPVLVIVGQVIPRKGQDLAARALQIVRRKHPQAILALIGAGQLPPEAMLPGVHLLGPRDDVADLIPHATAMLVPSRADPCPLVAFEGMACRVPVIGAAVSGIPEILADGGGLLVPKDDVEALAAATTGLLDDAAARERQAEAGLRRVLDRFSPGPHVEQLERHLATAAGLGDAVAGRSASEVRRSG